MDTVAFDESGNTGQFLVDPQQPVLTVASAWLTEDEAQAIVDAGRQGLPGKPRELHFKRLWAYPAGQAAVLRILDPATLPPERVKVCVTHKRFMTVAKMVDVLLEEMAFQQGVDIYSDGKALAFANLLYAVTPVLTDQEAFDATLAAFVNMARRPSLSTLEEFYRLLSRLIASCSDPRLREDLELMAGTKRTATDLLSDTYSESIRDVLDPALPAFVQLCRQWGAVLQTFQVLHDESRVIASWEATLHRLNELPDPEQPGRNMAPLPIAPKLVLGDSRQYPSLQVADIIAGATRQWVTTQLSGHQDHGADRLRGLTSPFVSWAIWPTPPPGA